MSSSRLSMTPAWVITMLQTQNWSEIKKIFSSRIREFHYLILSSAVCDVHHPEEQMRRQYGLSRYDNKLVSRLVEIEQKPYINRFDLIDFHKALRLAMQEIKCEKVAEHIRQYVRKHFSIFEEILKELPIELQKLIQDDFYLAPTQQTANRVERVECRMETRVSLNCSSALFGSASLGTGRVHEAPRMTFSSPTPVSFR